MCTPPPPLFFCWRGKVEPPTKFSKRGGLTGPQLLEGGCWKEGVKFFKGGGGALFTKKKLKSEIFNDKKSLLPNIFFSVITKNPKGGELGQFADLRGKTWQESGGWCFWGGGWCPNAHYVTSFFHFFILPMKHLQWFFDRMSPDDMKRNILWGRTRYKKT